MAMESQAEALGQLATDDLEGKVKMNIYKPIINTCLVLMAHDYLYLLVNSLHCSKLRLLMMIFHN
jgi:hypothetical protein